MNKHLPLLFRAPGRGAGPPPRTPVLTAPLYFASSSGCCILTAPQGSTHTGVSHGSSWEGFLPWGLWGWAAPRPHLCSLSSVHFNPVMLGLSPWVPGLAPLPHYQGGVSRGAHLGGTAEPEQALPLCSPRTVLSAPQRSTDQPGDPEPCTAGRCPGSQLCLGHSHQLCSAHTSNAGAFPAPISVQAILLPLGNSARFAL